MKKIALILIAVVVLCGACSAGGAESASRPMAAPAPAASAPQDAPASAPDMDYNMAAVTKEIGMDTGADREVADEIYGEYAEDQLASTDPDRKLIRRADLNFESTDFDSSVSALERLCFQHEGYVQESWQSGVSLVYGRQQMRSARYVMRIPKDKYFAFLGAVGTIGNLLNKSESSEDITESYMDIESRLEILIMRRERLIKLLSEATDAENIVVFERELSDTLYQIESMTGQLKKYDSLVDYTTVTVNVEEVVEYTESEAAVPTPKSVSERITASFGDSTEAIGEFFVDMFVFVAGNILYILIYAVILGVILTVVFRHGKRTRAKKNVPPPDEPPSDNNE